MRNTWAWVVGRPRRGGYRELVRLETREIKRFGKIAKGAL